MSKFFKGLRKKVSLKDAPKPEPRALTEINKEYSETLPKAGQAQYLVYVYTKELDEANKRLLSLNQEAKARQDIEAIAAAAANAAKKEEVQNEQA